MVELLCIQCNLFADLLVGPSVIDGEETRVWRVWDAWKQGDGNRIWYQHSALYNEAIGPLSGSKEEPNPSCGFGPREETGDLLKVCHECFA